MLREVDTIFVNTASIVVDGSASMLSPHKIAC